MPRLYHGMTHLTYKRILSGYDRRLIYWAANLKPGDVYGGCDGFNHIVSSVKFDIFDHKNGWFVADVALYNTTGRVHYAPGGGCVSKPYTRNQVIDVVKHIISPEGIEWAKPENIKKYEAIVAAESTDFSILDKNGVIIG